MPHELCACVTIGACIAGSAQAQTLLTAETACPTGVPGTTVPSLSEAASQAGIVDMQVTTGQTLTNSLQNVAEGKTDVGAALVDTQGDFLKAKHSRRSATCEAP